MAGHHLVGRLAARTNRKFATTRQVLRASGLADASALDYAVARNVMFTCGYYARVPLLLHGGYREQLMGKFDVRGLARLRHVLADHGAVLLAPHAGDFDLAGAVLRARLQTCPVVCTERVWPAARGMLYDRLRRSCGFELRAAGPGAYERLLGDLRADRLVISMLDRRPTARGVEVEFLGRRARVSAAPYTLAALAGAALVTAVSSRASDGQRTLTLGAAQWPSDARDRTACARVMQRATDEISAGIIAEPSQWHVPADVSKLPWMEL